MSDADVGLIGPGQVAVVTGAASGIGRALAETFAAEGSAVVVADLESDGAEAVAASIRDGGGDALAVTVDVADVSAVERLAATTVERYGHVDVLCNNAGVSTFNLMRDQTLADWKWVVDVNFWGVVHGIQTFLPIMREQGTPADVVNTASIGGLLTGTAFIGPYCATKAAVVSMKIFSLEILRFFQKLFLNLIFINLLESQVILTRCILMKHLQIRPFSKNELLTEF